MERVKSETNPDIEWEYHYENFGTKSSVASMYYKSRKALDVYEEQYVHEALVEPDYRFITPYTSLFIHYSAERSICEKNKKIGDNEEENTRNKLIVGCESIERRFIEIIKQVKTVI